MSFKRSVDQFRRKQNDEHAPTREQEVYAMAAAKIVGGCMCGAVRYESTMNASCRRAATAAIASARPAAHSHRWCSFPKMRSS